MFIYAGHADFFFYAKRHQELMMPDAYATLFRCAKNRF